MSHVVVLSTTREREIDGTGRHSLAGLNGGIPILWNLFFLPEDLIASAGRDAAGELQETFTPCSPKAAALERLRARVPWSCELFGTTILAEYASLLVQSVERAAGEYIAMDITQIAQPNPPRFWREYGILLDRVRARSERSEFDPNLRDQLLAQSGYTSGRPFPPARLLLEIEHPSWLETEDHARIVGASWTGSLAWEHGP